ncbi:hypothetical protein [Paenibacillus sp. 22594]|uniref:hypothetical protein n=1 Tax=Paenibacillus sp. 22594 TaxID=3453947 RepID=UPI003F87227E
MGGDNGAVTTINGRLRLLVHQKAQPLHIPVRHALAVTPVSPVMLLQLQYIL